MTLHPVEQSQVMHRAEVDALAKAIPKEKLEEAILQVLSTSERLYHDNYDVVFATRHFFDLGGTKSWPGEYFAGRVKRMLAKLRDDGRVAYVPPGTNAPLPDGSWKHPWGNQPRWTTAERYADAVEHQKKAHDEQARTNASIAERQAKLRQWAYEHDLDPSFREDTAILTLDDFERLLIKLEEPDG
jgi:hypothetical protein